MEKKEQSLHEGKNILLVEDDALLVDIDSGLQVFGSFLIVTGIPAASYSSSFFLSRGTCEPSLNKRG